MKRFGLAMSGVGVVGVAVVVLAIVVADDGRNVAAPERSTTTALGGPSGAAGFLSRPCRRPPALSSQSSLGIAVEQNIEIADSAEQAATLRGLIACLRATTARLAPLAMRTTVPVDGARVPDQLANLRAFAALVTAQPAATTRVVISVRAKDFARCAPTKRSDGQALNGTVERTALTAGEPLVSCQYPSPGLYRVLFSEIASEAKSLLRGYDVRFTAWNEPDHDAFTLRWAPLKPHSSVGNSFRRSAAYRAGEYWAQAVSVLGGNASRVLAGEFAVADGATAAGLRSAFDAGAAAGGGPPRSLWAIHSYDGWANVDALDTALGPGFQRRNIWVTESGARTNVSVGSAAQLSVGQSLRARLGDAEGTTTMLYLTRPGRPGEFDSAAADRDGRPRPVVCGLGGMPLSAVCPGDPAFR